MLQKNVVSDALMKLLEEMSGEKTFEPFMLAGGTALALQIGHRRSDDLDFFTDKEFNKFEILEYFERHYRNHYRIFHIEDDVIQLSVGDLKIDLIKAMNRMLDEAVLEGTIRLFGKKDIAAMKMLAICRRKEAKDFIDLGYLLKDFSLKEMLDFYKEKYGVTDAMNVKKALAECGTINPYQWEQVRMVRNDIFISDLREIFKKELVQYNGNGEKRGFGLFKKRGGKRR
jgi:predicted nucleotidyltransferase component of viral defense system